MWLLAYHPHEAILGGKIPGLLKMGIMKFFYSP